jgi:hypothetical protein
VPKADIGCLFDYLIGDLLEMQRHGKAERFSGFRINNQREFAGFLNREITGFSTLKDAVNVGRSKPIEFDVVNAVGC